MLGYRKVAGHFKVEAKSLKIIVPDDVAPEPTPLQYTLARAFHWQKMLDEGRLSP